MARSKPNQAPPATASALLAALPYRFQRPELLHTALTHRSASHVHNERLEFLGDALLGAVVAQALYQRFPRASEGELTRLRAALVREETLAAVARTLCLGDALSLGPGELKSGGYRRDSTLADALEALIGAIYLDGGFESCRAAVLQLIHEPLQRLDAQDPHKDPKTLLQEFVQARGLPLPAYQLLDAQGQDHQKTFFSRCTLSEPPLEATGRGPSRRAAEACAAQALLDRLREREPQNGG